ncbi:hypothetical protein [Sulfurimonas sp.]|uniref:hypothetical protein n=1 Tax=Sulfurimonas sp. TaxID=2022749 RepID=UPI002B45FD70|nr:hypothetical protein [Sulfurimonas sp.]
MKKDFFTIFIAIFIPLVFFSGCSTMVQDQAIQQNKNLEISMHPTRYNRIKSTPEADYYNNIWAGKKGRSIALKKGNYKYILNIFKKHCNFNEKDLLETRLVSHEDNVYYEVWVFKDSLSQREPKESGISVIFTEQKNKYKNGVVLNFIGSCHTPPFNMTFKKIEK